MKISRGFTLIELLVVIAIIGVLSAVVLAALNTSRGKGSDAAVKANLVGPREQAELFFLGNGASYSGVCDVAAAPNGAKSINAQVEGARRSAGISTAVNTAIGTAGSNTTVTCHATATGWAAEAPLDNGPPANPMFCTDSTGNATTTSGSSLSANDTQCG
ncbi:MAG: type II secretion system protein [Patescibacteria group bacterium]